MLNNAFCCASKEDVLEAGIAMSGHDDQIGRNFLREAANLIKWSGTRFEVSLIARG